MNYGIYYRVSTDRQDLESQEVAIRKFLAEQKHDHPPTIKEYRDEGISGKVNTRPGLESLMLDARAQEINTVMVYRLDRLSRSANTAIKLILELDEMGVAFVSVTQPILNLGHQNPFRRTMLAAFAEIAEIEHDAIVTRVKSGLAAARAKGVKLGAPRQIDPELVKMIAQERAAGKTIREVARSLDISIGSVHRYLKAEKIDPK